MFGSAIDERTLEWGADFAELDGVLERRFRFGAVLNSSGVQVDNILLRTNPGNTPYLTGNYTTPVVEMRMSRNAGKTWGNWRARSLGAQGEYRKKVQWEGCGMHGQPGIFGEVRVTDPVPFRVSDLRMNEPYGGI